MLHFIKNHLRVNYLQDGFVMYNDKLLIFKQEVIPPIPDYIIPEDILQKNQNVIKFTSDDMISKFEAFTIWGS